MKCFEFINNQLSIIINNTKTSIFICEEMRPADTEKQTHVSSLLSTKSITEASIADINQNSIEDYVSTNTWIKVNNNI